jgi:CP family cyanate transporter-like MFS transporter
MNRSPSADAGSGAPNLLAVLALLWLTGTALRLPLLVVPPVIPLIHDDLRMTETQVGMLVGLPLVMFALAAVPGSLLIARWGAMQIGLAGLLITALAAAARSAAVDLWTLYAATIVTGFGIAILQPVMPTLVRAWAPGRMPLASAVSINGIVVGATLGGTLTIPLVLPLVGQSWRAAILLWAVPGVVVALLFVVLARRVHSPVPAGEALPKRWWPDWKSPLLWLLGLTFGSNNALYFGINAFVPDYLNSIGRGDLIGHTLGWINGTQLLASLTLLWAAEHLHRRTWPFTVFGPLTFAGLIGVALCDGVWIVISAAVMGFAAAVTFVVIFAMPPILSPPDDVHRVAGGMFAISYTVAVVVPIVCGALWDLTGAPWTAFLPLAFCTLTLTVLGTLLSLRSART